MTEQISELAIVSIAHHANEMRLKELLHEVQQRLHRLASDVSREIIATIEGKPHSDDIVELATYRITHEVHQALVNLHLDSLAGKAAQYAVSRERLERLGVEPPAKES